MLSKGFGQIKANFDMKTGSLIWHYITCRILRDRQTLRNHWRSRNDYYFYQGLDKLNKEGDLGYIIKNIRVMRYFLKTVLEKDQRVLLKLKDKEIVSSADSDNPQELKKKTNKKILLENYVDFMQKKTLTAEDARLFKVLGQSEAFELLTLQQQKEQTNTIEDVQKNFLNKKETVAESVSHVWQRKVMKRLEQQEAREKAIKREESLV